MTPSPVLNGSSFLEISKRKTLVSQEVRGQLEHISATHETLRKSALSCIPDWSKYYNNIKPGKEATLEYLLITSSLHAATMAPCSTVLLYQPYIDNSSQCFQKINIFTPAYSNHYCLLVQPGAHNQNARTEAVRESACSMPMHATAFTEGLTPGLKHP